MDAISNADQLVQACLRHDAFAWQKLVDEYAPVVVLAIGQLAESTGRTVDQAARDELTRNVFEQLRDNDYALLRQFDRSSSLETFMVVLTRRLFQPDQESPPASSDSQGESGNSAD